MVFRRARADWFRDRRSPAAVLSFGIGSLLTPILALQVDTRLAVAAVSIPHVLGTALRFWLLNGGVDRRVLGSFGLTSAAGGLAAPHRAGWAIGGSTLCLAPSLFAATSQAANPARRMHSGRCCTAGRRPLRPSRRAGRQSGQNPIGGPAGVRLAEAHLHRHGDRDWAIRRRRAWKPMWPHKCFELMANLAVGGADLDRRASALWLVTTRCPAFQRGGSTGSSCWCWLSWAW